MCRSIAIQLLYIEIIFSIGFEFSIFAECVEATLYSTYEKWLPEMHQLNFAELAWKEDAIPIWENFFLHTVCTQHTLPSRTTGTKRRHYKLCISNLCWKRPKNKFCLSSRSRRDGYYWGVPLRYVAGYFLKRHGCQTECAHKWNDIDFILCSIYSHIDVDGCCWLSIRHSTIRCRTNKLLWLPTREWQWMKNNLQLQLCAAPVTPLRIVSENVRKNKWIFQNVEVMCTIVNALRQYTKWFAKSNFHDTMRHSIGNLFGRKSILHEFEGIFRFL